MATTSSDATIDAALDKFLTEQRQRLSPRTFHRYEEVVQSLRDSLDGYAYQALDDRERHRWEQEFATHEEGAFCRLFGQRRSPNTSASFSGTSWSWSAR